MENIVWIPLLCVLGALFGPYMFLTFPEFSLVSKFVYVLILIACIAGIILGWRKRKNIYGKFLIVAGVVVWTLVGLMGLGTGS